jgi:hypothetical protein
LNKSACRRRGKSARQTARQRAPAFFRSCRLPVTLAASGGKESSDTVDRAEDARSRTPQIFTCQAGISRQ